MDGKDLGRCLQKCLWYDQCRKCKYLDNCDDYCSIDDEDLTDEELLENKYSYRREFFEYTEESGLYD